MSRPAFKNNFPREGQHSPVTVDHLKALETDRTPNQALDYTIGGTIETEVHTTLNAERTYAKTRGYQIMEQASETLRDNHEHASRRRLTHEHMAAVRREAETHMQSKGLRRSPAQEQDL